MTRRCATIRLRNKPATRRPSTTVTKPDGGSNREAGLAYRKYLLREWCLGAKTCKELCSEAFLASRAGAVEIGDLGVDPDALGRNHARHLREILGLRDLKGSFYFVNVPVYDKRTASRVLRWIPVRLPHEIFLKVHASDPTSMDYKKQDPDEVMVSTYTGHPVVEDHGIAKTVPIGLYSDATPVYKSGSVLAGFCNITWQRKRHIMWLVLKKQMCQCGCNGRCTTDAIQSVINQSLNCLAAGVHMKQRFDGRPWREEDSQRAEKAGAPLPFHGAVTEYRCDWPEHCDVTRLKRWSARCPCPKCRCRSDNMHTQYGNCSTVQLPWDERRMDDYVDELTRQIITVRINSPDELNKLCDALRFRHAHPWGRAAARMLPEFELRTGDSLVCTEHIKDLHALEDCGL